MHKSCAVVVSFVNNGKDSSSSSSSSTTSSNTTTTNSNLSLTEQQQLNIDHTPPLPDTRQSFCTITTMQLNIAQIIEDAKRSQASVLLSNAWDSLIETLPWFLTPSDVRLTWYGKTQVTSLVVSINGGAIDFVLQIDMPTGWYRCSLVAKQLSQENHAPLAELVASCPLRAIEHKMNTLGGGGNGSSNNNSSNNSTSNNNNNKSVGSTLASILTRVQSAVVNAELQHVAGQAGLIQIAPNLLVQEESEGISLHASRTASFWNAENTTIFGRTGEAKLYCVCVGAGSDSDQSVRCRYLWPPICEIVDTKLPLVQSDALGPFRSLIQLRNSTVKQQKKRKRDSDRIKLNTVGTQQALDMLKRITNSE